ncbi:hypothetical protein ACHQM5_008942 [Ranunculus cassubicifolius]
MMESSEILLLLRLRMDSSSESKSIELLEKLSTDTSSDSRNDACSGSKDCLF